MNTPSNRSLISLWHQMALGSLWAVIGLTCIVDLRRRYWWEEGGAWWLVPALVGATYLITGVGFAMLRAWARRVMTFLMILSAFVFFSSGIMGGIMLDNLVLLWIGLAGCALAT